MCPPANLQVYSVKCSQALSHDWDNMIGLGKVLTHGFICLLSQSYDNVSDTLNHVGQDVANMSVQSVSHTSLQPVFHGTIVTQSGHLHCILQCMIMAKVVYM